MLKLTVNRSFWRKLHPSCVNNGSTSTPGAAFAGAGPEERFSAKLRVAFGSAATAQVCSLFCLARAKGLGFRV